MSGRGHPIFAALYDIVAAPAERRHFGAHRRDLMSRATGRVLEIGAGTGVNFAYYPRHLTVVALEPDTHMLRRAAPKARAAAARVSFVQAEAEHLPFRDGVFDTAVATLVLCSVASPLRVLDELRRVLRPGGQLLFYEHVRAATPGWQNFQDAITPFWRWVGGGCHPNRDTMGMLRRAGFVATTLEHLEFGPYPVRPHVKGVARAPAWTPPRPG